MQSLVTFIRKRDPRYKEHLAQQAAYTKSKMAQKASGLQPGTQMPKQAPAVFVAQSWQDVDTMAGALDAGDEWAAAEGAGDGDKETFECVACRKTFRSEAAWNSHARSKKHLKEMELLRREMLAEQEELDLQPEDEEGSDGGDLVSDAESNEEAAGPPVSSDEVDPVEEPSQGRDIEDHENRVSPAEHLSTMPTVQPIMNDHTIEAKDEAGDEPSPEAGPKPQLSKREKRRAKEAVKKAQEPDFVRVSFTAYLQSTSLVVVLGLQRLQGGLLLQNEAFRACQSRGTRPRRARARGIFASESS